MQNETRFIEWKGCSRCNIIYYGNKEELTNGLIEMTNVFKKWKTIEGFEESEIFILVEVEFCTQMDTAPH